MEGRDERGDNSPLRLFRCGCRCRSLHRPVAGQEQIAQERETGGEDMKGARQATEQKLCAHRELLNRKLAFIFHAS